jgi:ATP-binding cassette, subfamily B, bacterial MsbA
MHRIRRWFKARGRDSLSSWTEGLLLAAYFRDMRWMPVALIAFGLLAAVFETIGISFAVLFLFAILGQSERLQDSAGILSGVYARIEGTFGHDQTLTAVLFFVLILANALLVYGYQVVTATTMNRVAERARNLIHHRYVTVGYGYLQKREHGELVHTLGTESWLISDAFYSFARIAVSLCALIVFAAGIFALSWMIALTAFSCALLVFVLLRLLSGKVNRLGQQLLAANQLLAERMLVSLTGMRTLRVFAQEPYLLRVFGRASTNVREVAIRMERIKGLIGPIGEVASLGTLIIIAVVGSRAGIDIPTIVACVLLLFRLQPHLREIEANRMALAGLAASLRSVRDLLEPSTKPWPVEGKREFPGLRQGISFDHVTFFHDTARRPTLDRLCFALPCGQTTLLAGPSGSGKTTILNLLLRLYEPAQGRILVDGTDLSEYTRASWLNQVSIAGQDVELIEGTVLQNIRLGQHDASMEEVRQVCELVEILDDIEVLPDGFHARIGAAGLSLSGGQRQRIGLARALLRKPRFLILDEAMSALEPDREFRIRKGIAQMLDGATILVVSHRADAPASADNIIRIADGRIIRDPQYAA